MQTLNILIAGEGKSAGLFRNSKFLKKLYIASENEDIKDAVNIKFNTFQELARKCKSLQIDIVFAENEKWILQGIADVLRKNFVNCIAPSSRWAKLSIDYRDACKLMDEYEIKHSKEYSFPKIFPLAVRAGNFRRTAASMQELLSIRNEINLFPEGILKETFIEELIQGECVTVSSLFDGENLITYPEKPLTAEQIEKLNIYNKQLNSMLKDKNAEFTGFISSNLVWSGTEWYNQGFGLEFPELNSDILYVLISAIYQKLNELDA